VDLSRAVDVVPDHFGRAARRDGDRERDTGQEHETEAERGSPEGTPIARGHEPHSAHRDEHDREHLGQNAESQGGPRCERWATAQEEKERADDQAGGREVVVPRRQDSAKTPTMNATAVR
jgi:hypothetical protein